MHKLIEKTNRLKIDQLALPGIINSSIIFSISPTYLPSLFKLLMFKLIGFRVGILPDGIFEFYNVFLSKKSYFLFKNLQLNRFVDVHMVYGQNEFNFLAKIHRGNNIVLIKREYEPVRLNIKRFNKGHVLLLTSANSAYESQEEFEILKDIYNEIISQCSYLKIEVIYRFFDEKLVSLIPNGKLNNTHEKIEDIMKKCDSLITTQSTITLDAMANGLAVGHIIFRDTPHFLNTGWIFSNPKNVKSSLKSMIKKEEARMIYQDTVLENYTSASVFKRNFNYFNFHAKYSGIGYVYDKIKRMRNK